MDKKVLKGKATCGSKSLEPVIYLLRPVNYNVNT